MEEKTLDKPECKKCEIYQDYLKSKEEEKERQKITSRYYLDFMDL